MKDLLLRPESISNTARIWTRYYVRINWGVQHPTPPDYLQATLPGDEDPTIWAPIVPFDISRDTIFPHVIWREVLLTDLNHSDFPARMLALGEGVTPEHEGLSAPVGTSILQDVHLRNLASIPNDRDDESTAQPLTLPALMAELEKSFNKQTTAVTNSVCYRVLRGTFSVNFEHPFSLQPILPYTPGIDMKDLRPFDRDTQPDRDNSARSNRQPQRSPSTRRDRSRSPQTRRPSPSHNGLQADRNSIQPALVPPIPQPHFSVPPVAIQQQIPPRPTQSDYDQFLAYQNFLLTRQSGPSGM